MRDGCRAVGKAPREVEVEEYKGAKQKLSRQNENCDLREGLGWGWKEGVGDWECGIEKVDPVYIVSFSGCLECRKIAH